MKSCESSEHKNGTSNGSNGNSSHSEPASHSSSNGTNKNGKKNGNLHTYHAEKIDNPEHIKRAIIDMLESGEHHIGKICIAAKISQATYYKWIRDDDEFFQRVSKAKELRIVIAEDMLFNLVCEGDLGAICFFLTNRKPDEWKNTR